MLILILLHLIIFSTTYFVCHDGIGEISAHRRSLAFYPSPPPWQHQWTVGGIFWRLDLISFAIFAHVYFTTSDNFFNNILCVPWWKQWKLSPCRRSLASHPTPPPCQHQWAAVGIFWRLDLISFAIFLMFLLHLIIVLILHFLWHDRKDENSAHRLSLASWLIWPVSVAYICY